MEDSNKGLKIPQNFEATSALKNPTQMTARERIIWYQNQFNHQRKQIENLEKELGEINTTVECLRQELKDHKESSKENRSDMKWLIGAITGIIAMLMGIPR